MEIIKTIPENITSEKLAGIIDSNIDTDRKMKREIEKAIEERDIEPEQVILEEPYKIKSTLIDLDNESVEFDSHIEYEETIEYFLGKVDAIEEVTMENIEEQLPDPLDYDYEPILLRVMAELLKQNFEIREMMQETELTEEDVSVLNKQIINNKKKTAIIRTLVTKKEEEKEEDHGPIRNKLVFVPNDSGSPIVLSELRHIDSEYYDKFIGLFDSIRTGKFKNFNRLSYHGIFEVKDFKVRVLFTRLNKDTYAIISAFTKKVTTSKGYKEFVSLRATNYAKVADKLKRNLDNEEFLSLNSDYEIELDKILGKTEEKSKVLEKKGDQND